MILEVKNLALSYGERQVFSGLNLQVKSGQVVGILGQNGAGKTTLLRSILGQIKPESGEVNLAAGIKLSYLPQHGRFPRSAQIRGCDIVSLGLQGHKLGLCSARDARVKIQSALDAVGATAYANVPINLLSGGELQRIRIAAALVSEPNLLLVDEPLASLDVKHQADIVILFNELKARGTAILLVTHEINPVESLLDTVIYIAKGKAAVGSISQVMASESLSQLYEENIQVMKLGGHLFVINGESGKDLEKLENKSEVDSSVIVENPLKSHHHGSDFAMSGRSVNPKEVGY